MSEDVINNQTEHQEYSSEEALDAMERECEGHDVVGEDSVAMESHFESDCFSKASNMSFEEYSKIAIKVFHQINDMMGEFFDSLKIANEKFSRYADVYFETARQIAAKTEKKKLSDQEFDDLVVNLLTGMVVTGVGTLWSTIKTQVLLEKVKTILNAEAELKLKSIKIAKENIATVIECAWNQYDLCLENNSEDLNDLHEKFDALRLSFFSERLILFLEATYQAAQKNSFQNEYPYPSLFDLNQKLLEMLLNLDEKHSGIDAKTDYYRTAIKETIDNMERSIKEGIPASVAGTLLAMDSGLMAVAVYDCNPQETIGYTDEGELMGVDEDSLKPDCVSNLRMFCELYETGVRYKSSSKLGELLCENKSLKEARHHIMNLLYVAYDYGKRMLPLNINLFLGGILAFLIGMSNDIKWYWSLLLGVVALVVMAIVSPAKSITRKFMKKLNYVERTIKVTAMRNAGYSESIDLKAIQLKNNMGCMLAIIGFLIGSVFTPLGSILGLLAGFGLAKILSDKDDDIKEYDYNAVHTGSIWKGYLISALLVVGIIFTIIFWIRPTNDSVGTSSSESEKIVEEVVYEVASAETEIADEAVRQLLTMYYPISDDELNGSFDNFDGTHTPYYSDNIKNRFKEEGITNGKCELYTNSFFQLLEKVSDAEQKVGSLILDCNLLTLSQGDISNLDLKINNVTKKDNNNVEVEADFINGDVTHRRIYVLKRENGVFKINDFIDDGESVCKWLNDEIQNMTSDTDSDNKTILIDNWQLNGKIGKYPVVFYLDNSNGEIKGKYAYDSTLSKYGDVPESYLSLSGEIVNDNEISLTSSLPKKDGAFERIDLTISSQDSEIYMSGTLQNLNTGDKHPVNLQLVR